jgi:hypothetical protein
MNTKDRLVFLALLGAAAALLVSVLPDRVDEPQSKEAKCREWEQHQWPTALDVPSENFWADILCRPLRKAEIDLGRYRFPCPGRPNRR